MAVERGCVYEELDTRSRKEGRPDKNKALGPTTLLLAGRRYCCYLLLSIRCLPSSLCIPSPILSLPFARRPGYFAYTNKTLVASNHIEAQMWKMYALSDSRYITSDTFVRLSCSLGVL
jgi:hypothetical protein